MHSSVMDMSLAVGIAFDGVLDMETTFFANPCAFLWLHCDSLQHMGKQDIS